MAKYQLHQIIFLIFATLLVGGAAEKSRDVILVVASKVDGNCELYDIATNSWSSSAPLPETNSGTYPGQLLSAGVLPVGDEGLQRSVSMVYMCEGGMGSTKGCRRYDPELDQWFNDVSDTKKSRDLSSMVYTGDGKLYKVGGAGMKQLPDGSFDETQPIERYDPARNEWTVLTIVPKLKTSDGDDLYLVNTAASMYGNIVVTMVSGNYTIPQHVYLYNQRQDTWKSIAPIPAGATYRHLVSLPPSADPHIKRLVYALSECSDQLAVFTPESNLWETVELKFPSSSAVKKKDFDKVCEGRLVLGPDSDQDSGLALYLMGGRYQGDVSKELFKMPLPLYEDFMNDKLPPQNAEWQRLTPMSSARADFQPVVIKKHSN